MLNSLQSMGQFHTKNDLKVFWEEQMQNKIEKKLFTTASWDIKYLGIILKMCKISTLKITLQREIFLKP